MTNTTNQSGQRPPVANTARDLFDKIAEVAWHSERDDRPDLPSADRWKIVNLAREGLALESRLSTAEWAEAVERAADWLFQTGVLDVCPPSFFEAETESDLCRIVANAALAKAFPHLAPEDR